MKYAILTSLLGIVLITPGCGDDPQPNETGGQGGTESTGSSVSSSGSGGKGGMGTGGMGTGGMGTGGAGGANACGNPLVVDNIDPAQRCKNGEPLALVNVLSAPPGTVWADKILKFSSEYTQMNWAAAKAKGAPDVYPLSGDYSSAWASTLPDAMNEFIVVGYSTPVLAEAIWVYETYYPGAISKITVTSNDVDRVVYTNDTPHSIGDCSHILSVSTQTCDPITAVRIDLASPLVLGFNEIDAVGLIPTGASSGSSSSSSGSGSSSSSSSSGSGSSSSSSSSGSGSSSSSSSSSSGSSSSSSSSSSGGAMVCDNPTIIDAIDPVTRCGNMNSNVIVNPILPPADMVWSDGIVAFSSQFSGSSWSATRANGAPNVYPTAADDPNAWAADNPDTKNEFITVSYSTPVVAEALWVYETYNPGSISSITVTAADGDHLVYTNNTPQSIGPCSHILSVSTQTCSPISAVRIDLASPLVIGYNEIDAVGLLPAK